MECCRLIACFSACLLSALAVLALAVLLSGPEAAPDLELADLSDGAREWFGRGALHRVLGQEMFVVTEGEGPETLILVHGFPASSYDYHRAVSHLLDGDRYRVVLFDLVGYGFSSKPAASFTYSMPDQAEQCLALWRQLGIDRAHVVGHDMGDSVLTEILSRRDR